ncbi:hypothetical protein [Acinetobacter calcoaceticus]|uniref:hypothetical protein n=1 Tax=Acinetobacter calcoaceticus TaxID=471 RepID=UPI001E55A461|nr:hypothetical protein [Acinetobacter calcoaceticus]UGQ25667.1 hypothetical protein LRO55_15075 [Acinetobacter calcoaceticus]
MNIKVATEKNIVSESNLLKIFMNNSKVDISNIPKFKEFYLDDQDLNKLLEAWKFNIERDANLLYRQSLSSLTDLPDDSLYYHLDKSDWLKAAQVTEVFRNPLICKNAGRLDLKNLQKNVQKWITSSDENLNLIIGWGQPKRPAGGIKSIGPYADLAELFSISRLITIVKALESIIGCNITMTVLTGGSRFFSALFTRPEITNNYDIQRQFLADLMDENKKINFVPFVNSSHNSKESIQVNDEVIDSITNDQILSKIKTITLNIDWEHLFHPNMALRYKNPHNIKLSLDLEKWLEGNSTENIVRFIRISIYCLITGNYYNAEDADFEDHTILDDMVSFMHDVAWESTKKYIAIHEINELNDTNLVHDNNFRLTVHEKSGLRTLPAILTLGVNGGNQLSQHVVTYVHTKEPIFGAFAEFWDKDLSLVKLKKDCNYKLFNWLKEYNQPLFISSLTVNEVLSFLNKSSKIFN